MWWFIEVVVCCGFGKWLCRVVVIYGSFVWWFWYQVVLWGACMKSECIKLVVCGEFVEVIVRLIT